MGVQFDSQVLNNFQTYMDNQNFNADQSVQMSDERKIGNATVTSNAFSRALNLGCSKEAKRLNNEIRNSLLEGLSKEFKGIKNLPKAVKDVLKLDDFGLDKNGWATSGKPLTQRRIQAVLNAVAESKVLASRSDVQDTVDKTIQSVISGTGMNALHEKFGDDDFSYKIRHMRNCVRLAADWELDEMKEQGQKVTPKLVNQLVQKLMDKAVKVMAYVHKDQVTLAKTTDPLEKKWLDVLDSIMHDEDQFHRCLGAEDPETFLNNAFAAKDPAKYIIQNAV